MTQRVLVISPELALIDQALAEQARAELPDPGEFLADRLPAAQEPSVLAAANSEPARPPDVEPQPRRRRRTRALGRVLVAAILLLAGFSIGRMTATPPPGFIIEQVVDVGSASRSLQRRSTAPAAGTPRPRTNGRSKRRTRAKQPSAGPVVAGKSQGRGAKGAAKRRNPRKPLPCVRRGGRATSWGSSSP